MRTVVQSSGPLAVAFLLLLWPLSAIAQMPVYGPSGFDQASMSGSCASCQQSFGEPEWYDGSSGSYDSDLFESQCGCDDMSSMAQDPYGDPGMPMPYGSPYAMPQSEWDNGGYGPNSCGLANTCGMSGPCGSSGTCGMSGPCGSGTPFGVPSACDQCNSCGGGCGCQMNCPCGSVAPFWFGAEALIWNTSSVNLPVMVTTSDPGTQQLDAGILGRPTTQTLYGGNDVLGGTHGGFRLRGGHYFDPCGVTGIDLEYFMLGTQQFNYHGDSTGNPILARPFLNAETGMDDGQLVAFPGLAGGSIDIKGKTNLYSGALHFREVFWKECDPGNECAQNCRRSGPRSFTMGFQIGPRFVTLRDSFSFNEHLANPQTQAQYNLYDSFSTRNQFWGCELGLFGSRQRRRWSLDGAVRLAIGGTKQDLDVYGQTAVTQAGVTTTNPGGFLAQRTNSGSFDRNRFTLIPQFDIALGYQMTDTWTASVGYSLLYWGNVVRAVEQIDPVVNPGLLPPEQIPLTGDLRPEARFQQTDYLAHGITIGLEKRW